MTVKGSLDKAGRLVLPKKIRDELQLHPGDELEVSIDADRIVLSPVNAASPLAKEQGVWVYRSGKTARTSIAEIINEDRRNRSSRLSK